MLLGSLVCGYKCAMLSFRASSVAQRPHHPLHSSRASEFPLMVPETPSVLWISHDLRLLLSWIQDVGFVRQLSVSSFLPTHTAPLVGSDLPRIMSSGKIPSLKTTWGTNMWLYIFFLLALFYEVMGKPFFHPFSWSKSRWRKRVCEIIQEESIKEEHNCF